MVQRYLRPVVLQRVVRRQDYHFRLQYGSGIFVYGLSYVHHEVIYIVRGGSAGVDDKARVLLRDLRPAYAAAFKTGLIYERRGVAALGAPEGASGRRQIQRLLFTAALVELTHLCGYLLAASLL